MTQGVLCGRCGALLMPGEECGCVSALTIRRQVYDSRAWRDVTRPAVIARDDGLCVKCGKPGTIVDHIVPIETLVALGADPLDPNECQLLCHACSGQKDGARSSGPAPTVPW